MLGFVELDPTALRLLKDSAKPELATVFIKDSSLYYDSTQTEDLLKEMSTGNTTEKTGRQKYRARLRILLPRAG